MGIFSRNKNKTYSLAEAMKMLKTEKFANYTAIPINEDNSIYRLIPEEAALEQARETRKIEKRNREQKEGFSSRITGDGAYKNIGLPNYNDYQVNSRRRQVNLYR